MGANEHICEEEILNLLREAYDCALRLDARGYNRRLLAAKAAIDQTGQLGSLYGEWLLVCAYANYRNIDAYLSKLDEASSYLNGRSRVIPDSAGMFIDFYSPFFIINNHPGDARVNAQKLARAEELFYHMTGGGWGTTEAYLTQLAFYRGELDEARARGLRALDEADERAQPLNALCASETLAFIARYTNDDALWKNATYRIKRMAAGDSGAAAKELARIVECSLNIGMGILPALPRWIRELDFDITPGEWGFEAASGNIPSGAFPAALIMLAQYLLYAGKPAASLAMADIIGNVYNISGVAMDIYLEFFRAGCRMRLGDLSGMEEAISRAIELAAPDGLWLIAAEFEHFGEAIYKEAGKRDSKAPERIRLLGENILVKLKMKREAELKTIPSRLSAREREVAGLIMRGQKNTQIARSLGISESTVKTHMANICRKLNVKRRTQLADALRDNDISLAFWAD